MPVSRSARVSALQTSPPLSGFPAPWWSAPSALLYLGDVRECLRRLPTRSVHMVCTSPPYWGLRDYGTGTWDGGDPACDHVAGSSRGDTAAGGKCGARLNSPGRPALEYYKGVCQKCGATRVDMQIGAEPSHDCDTKGQAQCGACFVCSMVSVFREVHRVLRDDGTCWLNLGDKYDGEQLFVPTLVALALRRDGWIVVQDIIWHAPNKMPESVENRCTKSHEHIFLLAKSWKYYFDNVAIMQPAKSSWKTEDFLPNSDKDALGDKTAATPASRNGRSDEVRSGPVNKRDVWIVPTRGYSGAHFAVYSPQLITPCILAGTSEHGCCAKCGRPYERVVTRVGGTADEWAEDQINPTRDRSFEWSRNGKPGTNSTLTGTIAARETVGWRKRCGCATDEVAPCVVLDPFVGSGTTVATSIQLGRAGVGIDLSETYLRENAVPRIEAAMPGDRSGRKTVALRQGAPPAPRRLRGTE